MKNYKTFILLPLLMISLCAVAQDEVKITRAKYGDTKADLYAYFEPFFESELNINSFKRSIFKLGIDADGKVVKVAAVNHPLSVEDEGKIIAKIHTMKWHPKLNPEPVSSIVFLVLIVDDQGELTIEIR